MKAGFINIGFGNILSVSRIIAILNPGSRALKRLRDEAKERGKLIDASGGKKVRSIIITDSDHIILSAIQVDTLLNRLNNLNKDSL
ncbi:MAG: DUF370 domain-containing protein [Thermodesulfovibrionales bacterium]|nr:DUF370 domain-containing protein [Thermodesulfovibrionales bacterium]